MDLSTTFRFVNPKLEDTKGFHRFAWDLKTQGAWHKEEKRRYQGGPMALPSNYTLRLVVGDTKLHQGFSILMDPKVEAQGLSLQDLKAQQRMQNEVIALLTEARQFECALEKDIKVLKKTKEAVNKDELERKEAVLSKLQNAEGAYPQQMLLAQISYLQYAVGGSADQLPGKDTQIRLEELKEQLKELKSQVL